MAHRTPLQLVNPQGLLIPLEILSPIDPDGPFGAFGFTPVVRGKIHFVPTEIYGVKSIGIDGINASRNYVVQDKFRNSHCFQQQPPGRITILDG